MVYLESGKLSTSFNGYTIRMRVGSLGNIVGCSLHLHKDGEGGFLVRDSKRILKLKLVHIFPSCTIPQLIALPWDSSQFELRVNQTVYSKGPVLLSAGDELQLCLPCGWSDDHTFEITVASASGECSSSGDSAPESKHVKPLNVSSHSDPIIIEVQKDTGKANIALPTALWCDSQRTLTTAAREEFVKWSHFYAYRYNNLYRSMSDMGSSAYLSETAAAASSSAHDFIQYVRHGNSPIEMRNLPSSTSHAMTNLDAFTTAEGEKAGRSIFLISDAPLRQKGLLERCCCMCPLLGDVSKVRSRRSLKPIEIDPSPWQTYVMSRIS
ncbi:unnamed protein product [Phytomonas sp. EM1]|nr:unnamed protein product [Phytomonas sp. EM1]|eukprot:CCW60651.1 unnamed protein product [Phytomonas sp. isolate EM1]